MCACLNANIHTQRRCYFCSHAAHCIHVSFPSNTFCWLPQCFCCAFKLCLCSSCCGLVRCLVGISKPRLQVRCLLCVCACVRACVYVCVYQYIYICVCMCFVVCVKVIFGVFDLFITLHRLGSVKASPLPTPTTQSHTHKAALHTDTHKAQQKPAQTTEHKAKSVN